MTLLEALLLGLIQGLTEFLPVSSSGHLELAKIILGVELEENVVFSTLLHFATSLSTVFIFRKDLGKLIIETVKLERPALNYSFLIICSSLPILIIGLFFKDTIEILFQGQLLLVAVALGVTGFLLLFSHSNSKSFHKSVGLKSAFIIGVAQAIAILPGISRSGATIATALLLNTNKKEATRFSFLMVLIPIWGASLLGLKDLSAHPNALNFNLLVGFITAFGVGLLSCKWMLNLVQKGKLIYFGWYCLGVSIIAILYYCKAVFT